MTKAPVLFFVLILAAADLFACDSCQCNCSSQCPAVFFRPGALIQQMFSGCDRSCEDDNMDDCNDCLDESENVCLLSPCFGSWAFLCDQCGGGEKRFICVRCGQSGARTQALLCPQCSSIRRYCIKCGKPGARIPARLCDQCGYGEKKNECVKCGKIYR